MIEVVPLLTAKVALLIKFLTSQQAGSYQEHLFSDEPMQLVNCL